MAKALLWTGKFDFAIRVLCVERGLHSSQLFARRLLIKSGRGKLPTKSINS